MAQMNITVPDKLKAWARLQAAIDAGRASPRSERTLQEIIAARRG